MIQSENHLFQGLRRDNHEIKQDGKYLWDAHNIRLTNRDHNTLLSITNEKGTLYRGVSFEGDYVGHCVLGKYLVVFTAKESNKKITSYIYRVENTESGPSSKLLYSDTSLGLSPEHPIETLGIFENESIQKVYWIDDEHQPRFINIVQETEYKEGSFDFVSDLKLQETIEVKRDIGGGVFSPGVIQYAFSYYNKYGSETNLFYTTELLYISANNRGGSPEETIDNIFNITVKNIDPNFQYLRIYSIHRTSIDAVPTVKSVTDIDITNININEEGILKCTYTDTGRSGTTEDPTKLLYIGGEHIIANSFTHKDGTLFLGNIKIERQDITKDIKDKIKTAKNESQITIDKREIGLTKDALYSNSTFYNYNNQLLSGNCSTFKVGDKYRLGIQFQYKNGKWSSPIWIEDKTIPREKEYRPSINNGLDMLTVPKLIYKLKSDIISDLVANHYKKARALIVMPTVYDRMTLAQGVVCPTVFSANNRTLNAPFAQSSWFFRLMSTSTEVDLTKGNKIVHKHLDPLYFNPEPTKINPRGLEIQNMETVKNGSNISIKYINEHPDISSEINTMFVDQSILTLHSPDIEFDDSVKIALDNKEMELYLVGLAPFTSNVGDISIETSTPPPGVKDTGFLHKTTFVINKTEGVDTSLTSGLFYLSHMIEEKTGNNDTSKYVPYKDTGGDSYKYEYKWLVHPWNKTGSIINDINRPEGGGTQTATLKRKVISNLKYSPDNTWFSTIYKPSNGIAPVQIFNSNEVSLVKVPSPNLSSFKYDGINYYGNVDSLITTDTKYPLYYSTKDSEDLLPTAQNPTDAGNTTVQAFNSPVRIKYKSTPHAVVAFNYNAASLPLFLPSVGNLNKADVLNINTTPYWIQSSEDIGITALGKEYTILKASDCTIIQNTVQYGNVGIKGANTRPEDQDRYNKDWLKSKQDTTINKSKWAIMTSTIAVSSTYIYGDFYKYNSGTNEWERCDYETEVEGSPDNRVVYYISGHNSYWEKTYAGTGYTMKQVIVTGDPNNPGSGLEDQIVIQPNIHFNTMDTEITEASLFLAELVRTKEPANIFGGDNEQALQNNLWIPAGNPVSLELNEGETELPIEFIYGDTYYQRYDCLKTYPFTMEDENSVVEIGSFMCETRVNIDGRYDRNRAQLSNLNMSPLNFNKLNPVYSQKDIYFNYRILPEDYYKINKFSNQITWSKEKHAGEDVDTWTNITLASTLDMNGSKGSITSLKTWNEYVLCFQEKEISKINFNSRVQIPTSDGVPIEISNGYKVDGATVLNSNVGCNNKWSINDSLYGVYFIDSYTDNIYLFNGEFTNLSNTKGVRWWSKEHSNNIWTPKKSAYNGVRTFIDSIYGDVYFSPGPSSNQEDALYYSEQLGEFVSQMSYGGVQAMFNFNDGFYSLHNIEGTLNLYQNNVGSYNYFYGKNIGWNFSFISNDNPLYTKVFDTIELRADHYAVGQHSTLLNSCPLSYISASNEYQDSDKVTLDSGNMRKKFRVWRGLIPRNKGTIERIRNPWTMITLGWDTNSTTASGRAVVHDVTVKYTV